MIQRVTTQRVMWSCLCGTLTRMVERRLCRYVVHSYDTESDYFVVKKISNDLQTIIAAEVDVEFDGVIMVEWTDFLETGAERCFDIESITCCFDTLLVSTRHYLLNKSINN
jgi:hypothetical protein